MNTLCWQGLESTAELAHPGSGTGPLLAFLREVDEALLRSSSPAVRAEAGFVTFFCTVLEVNAGRRPSAGEVAALPFFERCEEAGFMEDKG